MRVGWNERTITWLEAASEFTGFHRKLAELLRPHLHPGGTLCDLGCGLGLIDLELSPWFERITCLDTSAPALAALERLAARRGCTNLEPVRGDVEELEGEWDSVLGVFFGFGDRIPQWLSHCRRSLVVVVADGGRPSFGPGHPAKRYTADYAQALLEEAGIPYRMERHGLEYGQPFRSLEEAEEFGRIYSGGSLAEDLAYLHDRLTATGDPVYPWYLPQEKRFAVFSVQKGAARAR